MLPFRKILCPTDYSEPSQVALERAIELAQHFSATLCLLHVVPPVPNELGIETYASAALTDADREALDSTQIQLSALIDKCVPDGVKAYPEARLGHVADEIERAARVEEADLIVIATHGNTGWHHLVFGSVTEKVLRQVRVPVLVIHQPQT